MKTQYIVSLFITSTLFTLPKNEQEWSLFLFTWATFIFLVTFGCFPRIILNKEKSHANFTFYMVFRTFVIALFVCFVAKELLTVLELQRHEIWAIPVIAFSSELILSNYGNNIEDILSAVWQRLKNTINSK